MGSETNTDNSEAISIGRIPLKQVRVKRAETSGVNPMNRLVPYLDLFYRLADDELARLAGVDDEVAATLRKQVVAIDQGLAHYADLLPRLSDAELVRLTGATAKTIRFWRLCQPRTPPRAEPEDAPEVRRVAEVPERAPADDVVAPRPSASTAPQPAAVAAEPSPSESMTRGITPSETTLTPADPSPPTPTPPPDAAATQVSAKRFMQFSGEPFPGFEEAADELTAEELDAVEIEQLSEEDLLEDPLPE